MVGFVGHDGQGLAGLEFKFNRALAGVEGEETFESAPNGSRIPLGASSIKPAKNGVSYQLTLDLEVQWVAERRLAEAVRQTKADFGVRDHDGPQDRAGAGARQRAGLRPGPARSGPNPEDRGNRAVSAPYEPGSVQKVLTAAALIDSGTATPETRVKIPPGCPRPTARSRTSFSMV